MRSLNPRLYYLLFILGCLGLADGALAQIIPQTTGSGVTNTPNPGSGPNISITGGILSSNGTNLFHSFDQFNLNDGQTATFATQGANNILARVVGGSPSVIDGILKTSSNASLYLMNPMGILFGKNAVVDIQGSLVATTAHGIGFGNNLWFNAIGPNDYPNLLTSNPHVLGFNGPSGAIVNSGELSANSNGNGPAQLALVGSTVVNTGTLKATGEGIAIATVNSPQTVRLGIGSDILGLEVAAPTATMPAAWTLPVLNVPALITGGNSALVTNLVNNPDGTVSLQSQPIQLGDIASTQLTQAVSADKPGAINFQAQNNLTLTGELALAAKDSGFAPSELKLTSGADIQAGNVKIDYVSGNDIRNEQITLSAPGRITVGNIDRFAQVNITGSEVTLGNVTMADRVKQPQYDDVSIRRPRLMVASTTGMLTTGAILAPGGGVVLQAQGDLSTGRINTFPSTVIAGNSQLSDSGIELTSQTGNILSQSLQTGDGSIKMKAPGTVRVYGTDDFIDIYDKTQTIYLELNSTNQDLVNYLVGLGIPLPKLQSASQSGITYIPVVYSARGNVASTRVPNLSGKDREVGSPALSNDLFEQDIGVKPFYTGGLSPEFSINSGNPLVDFDPTRNQGRDPNLNNIQPFTLERRHVPLNDFPAGISGSPIGIVNLEGNNASLVGSTISRPFIPAPPAPLPDPLVSPAPIPAPVAPLAPPTPIAPPTSTPPDNSPGAQTPGSQTTVANNARDRQPKTTLPCGQSKQLSSAQCGGDERGDAAILRILE